MRRELLEELLLEAEGVEVRRVEDAELLVGIGREVDRRTDDALEREAFEEDRLIDRALLPLETLPRDPIADELRGVVVINEPLEDLRSRWRAASFLLLGAPLYRSLLPRFL